MTNGGGPGVMATDALVLGGGKLAALSPETTMRLDKLLPPTWSHGNPVDIIGDAPAQRYAGTLDALLDEPGADAVLFMHVPSAIAPAVEIARACASRCAPTLSGARVVSCWLGGDGLDEARNVFEAAGIPTYDTPERAVAAFLQLVNYRRNQESLMQIPGTTRAAAPDIAAAARSFTKR